MSKIAEHIRDRVPEKMDIIAAIGGIFLGAVISAMNLIYSNAYLITIGPMLIITCAFYLLFRHRLLAETSEPQTSQHFVLLVNILFWLSFAVSIYTLSTETLHRPPAYFILTAFAASMVATQILYVRTTRTTVLVLFEILLLTLSVGISAYWVFPTIHGSDPWAHVEYVRDFVNTEHIESTRGWIVYLNYPITHLNVVAAKLLANVDYKAAMFLGIGLPYALSAVFVFLIGRSLAGVKIGLLAALLTGLSDVHLQFGIDLMPTSYGIMFFAIIACLLLRKRGTGQLVRIGLIAFLFLIIITHNMSSFVLLCLLASFLIGVYVYKVLFQSKARLKDSSPIPLPSIVLMFIIAMLGYWIYAGFQEGRSFFENIVEGLYNSLAEEAGLLARPESPIAQYGYLKPIMDIAGFVMIYLFGTLGILIWLARKNIDRNRIVLICAVTLLTISALLFPVMGIRNIMPYRWYAFIYIILSVPAAVAIFTVVQRLYLWGLTKIVLICITFSITFLMLTNSFTNTDSPIYSRELNQQMVYTDAEMATARKIIEVSGERWVVTDLQYGGRVLTTHMGRDSVARDMQNEEWIKRIAPIVIWRNIMADRPIQTPDQTVILGDSYKQNLENSHDLIYTNNASGIFLPGE
ncbi:MAG: hypothetical protein HOC20_12360 [Chloroflexi bacterium]|jgi:hypothetical protein|nr:hypothetical protein [Chloroflexota bacterium]